MQQKINTKGLQVLQSAEMQTWADFDTMEISGWLHKNSRVSFQQDLWFPRPVIATMCWNLRRAIKWHSSERCAALSSHSVIVLPLSSNSENA